MLSSDIDLLVRRLERSNQNISCDVVVGSDARLNIELSKDALCPNQMGRERGTNVRSSATRASAISPFCFVLSESVTKCCMIRVLADTLVCFTTPCDLKPKKLGSAR